MPRRTWGVSEQKWRAAKQGWKCAICCDILPAAFELDHIKPLFDGGEDCYITNSQALCPNCHAAKTQKEAIQRRELKSKRQMEAIESARKLYEQDVWMEENLKRTDTHEKSGARRCNLCKLRYYPIFAHRCKVVEHRVETRLSAKRDSKKPRTQLLPNKDTLYTPSIEIETYASNPFLQFMYTESTSSSTKFA